MGLTSDQNSVMPKFGGVGAEGLRSQKLFFFKLINRKFKIVKYIQKLIFLVNLEGEMKVFFSHNLPHF